MSIPRRAALLLLPTMASGGALAAPAGVRFRVMREGQEIGSHRVTLTAEGDRLRAASEVDIVVRVLGFTVCRYRHDSEELWQGDRLLGIRSRAEKQGVRSEMTARAEAGALVTEAGLRLPEDAAPLSWWRESSMRRPLFDTTTGQLLPRRAQRLAMPQGGLRWSIEGNPGGDALYAGPDGAWIGFTTRGEDGSAISYEPG